MKEKTAKTVKAKAAIRKSAPIKIKVERRVSKKEAAPRVAESVIGLHKIIAPFGAHKKRKLLGRGPGSGHGKTSTRGSKGQTSRAGRHFYLGFEGGQSPLIRKMPKRGFVSNFKKTFQVVNLQDLNKIKETTITPEVLKASGLIRDKEGLVKILGKGSIKSAVTICVHAFSKRAAQEIIACGGKVELINV